MSDKTPLQKMFLKSGMSAALLHVPDTLEALLALPSDAVRVGSPTDDADFVLDFASTQAQAEERLRTLAPHVHAKSVAWTAYPKGSNTAGFDLNRDTLRTFAPRSAS